FVIETRARRCLHLLVPCFFLFFFFQAEDGIRDLIVTGVQTCALPISASCRRPRPARGRGPGGAIPWAGSTPADRARATGGFSPCTPEGCRTRARPCARCPCRPAADSRRRRRRTPASRSPRSVPAEARRRESAVG